MFGIRPVLLHPESRGEVLLRSANPRDPVRLVPRFFSAQSDIATLREGYTLGLEMVQQATARQVSRRPRSIPIRTPTRRGHRGMDQAEGDHRASSVRDLPDGRAGRQGRRARSGAAREGHRGPARDRRLGDARSDLRQHQRRRADDRRERAPTTCSASACRARRRLEEKKQPPMTRIDHVFRHLDLQCQARRRTAEGIHRRVAHGVPRDRAR